MRANCWKATGGRPCEPCGGLQRRPAGDYAAPRGNCVGGEGITLPIHRQGDFLCAVRNCAGYSRRPPAAARELCEDFAPRNGATRAREERGANRARKPKTKGSRGVEREPCQPQGSLCLPEAPSPCRPGGPIPLSADPNKKTPGGRPACSPILLILLSLLFPRTQVDAIESFQVRFQQRKHFCDAPFVGGFHV